MKGPVGPGTARVHGRQGRGMPGAGRSAKQGTRGCEKKGRVCQTCDSSGGSSRVCSSAKPGQGESPRRQATWGPPPGHPSFDSPVFGNGPKTNRVARGHCGLPVSSKTVALPQQRQPLRERRGGIPISFASAAPGPAQSCRTAGPGASGRRGRAAAGEYPLPSNTRARRGPTGASLVSTRSDRESRAAGRGASASCRFGAGAASANRNSVPS